VRVLLNAFSQLPSALSAHALIIGPITPASCLPSDLDNATRDRIHFVGSKPNAAALVAASTASFIPSRWRDGLPKKAIEAMIQRVPVIATAAGGLAELIVDGSSGIIVPADDVDALHSALQRVLTDRELAETLREGGMRRIEGAFSIESTIEQTATLYQQLLRA
jgi:glycosyltransferase involved in cell wall biosynthesis